MHRVVQMAIVGSLVVAYELATRLQLLDSFTFVSFSQMVVTLSENLRDAGFVSNHLWPTALEIISAFGFSAALGVIVGILLWRSDLLHFSVQPYLLLLYAIPSFALYPIFISLFGMGSFAVVLAASLHATPAVVLNTAVGFRQTRESLIKVGRSHNVTSGQMLLYVFLPSAWPYIFTGLRLAAVYSIIGVIATEFILSARGIGYTVSYNYNNFDLNNMYASILLVLTFSIVVTSTLRYLEGRLYRQ